MIPQYRILQTSPTQWELDRVNESGVWEFKGNFDSQLSAQNAMAALIAAEAWVAPPPTYFDALGNVTTSVVQAMIDADAPQQPSSQTAIEKQGE